MCGFMFGMFVLKEAYINSPEEFTIRFEIENNTQKVINGLNGSITINNYYGNFTKEITLCKDTFENFYENSYGEFISKDHYENIYECNLSINKNG